MFGQIAKVGRYLQFVGEAKHEQNVRGPFHEKMVHFHDHFLDDVLSTDKWAATVTNHTIAVHHSTYPGGQCRIAMDTTNNEVSYLATSLMFEDDQKCICEARILLTDVSGTAVFFGFSDARSETSPDMPIDYYGGLTAATGVNAVGFISDAADGVNTANSIMAVGALAGSVRTAIDTGVIWEDVDWHDLRVELNPDGDATFYLDTKRVGFMETAVTSGSHLCIITAVANRDGAVDYVYLDRVDGWQNEVPDA